MSDWLAGLIGAAVVASGAWLATRFGRMAKLEARIVALETVNRRQWLYNRELLDHIYKGRPAPPPPPPANLFGEEE